MSNSCTCKCDTKTSMFFKYTVVVIMPGIRSQWLKWNASYVWGDNNHIYTNRDLIQWQKNHPSLLQASESLVAHGGDACAITLRNTCDGKKRGHVFCLPPTYSPEMVNAHHTFLHSYLPKETPFPSQHQFRRHCMLTFLVRTNKQYPTTGIL